MKKLLILLVSISLFTACDNEALDPGLLNDSGNNGGGNTSEEPLALDSYSFDVNSAVPIFGTIIVNSDFFFNSDNHVNNSTVASTFFGQTATENVTFSRNASNQITGYVSMSSGAITNQTTVTYSGNQVSQIVYNYVEDDEDDYTYNFVYTGNTVTRTEVGSTISTVFTFNTNGKVTKKESFDGTTSILKEVVTYDANGNCSTSSITGEENTSSTFAYDANESPLKDAFSDQYMLSLLNDDYSDEIGSSLAQFDSHNNWIGITTPEGTVNFTVQYDSQNRITSRNGNYDLGDGVVIQQAENFQFVN